MSIKCRSKTEVSITFHIKNDTLMNIYKLYDIKNLSGILGPLGTNLHFVKVPLFNRELVAKLTCQNGLLMLQQGNVSRTFMEAVGRLKTCLIRRKFVRILATQTIITLLPNFWMFAQWKLMLDHAEEISRFMLLTRIPKDAKSFSTEVGLRTCS